MRRIIKNAIYDTDKARMLTSAIERSNPFLPENTEVFLYRKRTANTFITKFPKKVKKKIVPTTREKAKQWLLTHFSEKDAENILMPLKTRKGEKVKVLVPFDAELKAELMASAEDLGMSQNEFIF